MSSLIIFESKHIRRVWNESEQKWYFSVQDVIEILTESKDIKQYVKKLKSGDPILSDNWGTICTLVEMKAADGKIRKVKAANTESLLRIIQSIPSPKAAPFKCWLTKIETGFIKSPSVFIIANIAKGLDVPIEDLLK